MQNSFDVSQEKSLFWKKNENVPGRAVSNSIQNFQLTRDPKALSNTIQTFQLTRDPKSVSPKKNSSKPKHRKTSSSSSFQEFQDSTEDAWDIGEDEFGFNPELPIHSKVAESTAIKVLNNHSKGTLSFVTDTNIINSSTEPNRENFSENAATKIRPAYSELKSYVSKEETLPKLLSIKGEDSPVLRENFASFDSSNSLNHHGPGIGIRQTKKTSFFDSSNVQLSCSLGSTERDASRLDMFFKLLNNQNTDIKELRKLSWSGIPTKVRPVTWKLLSGFLPTCFERRESFLERKKQEYASFVRHYYDIRDEDVHHETYRQIHIDVPRMSPLVPLFQQKIVQMAFERILYILAIRHPASGYVQGMNDLVTPYFVVFLQDYIPPDADVESYDVSTLDNDLLLQIEADSYWCMAKLLDGIQDNYTFAQPGIQKKVNMLKELIQRIDFPLHNHLRKHSIEYLQFSFRWMNNLLMRELPLSCTIRLWDTYLSEANGFSNFHLYVCAAFLKYWSKELLQEKDFQGLMLMLQNLPTIHWSHNEISILVAEAYRLKYMFDDAPNHLQPRD